MTPLLWGAAATSTALLLYLFVALLDPERFS